ncbi:MAG: hypothetical protein R3E66_15620 [bacterium]
MLDEDKPVHLVSGLYEGEIDAKPGEKVVSGRRPCSVQRQRRAGKPVEIESEYVDRSKLDPHNAKK